MQNIILIAPPAAGKGTQSKLLNEKYQIPHISTGDLLREATLNGTEIGNEIKKIMASGNLVSDEIVLELLKNKIKNIKSGFILDGFPRNLEQANKYLELINELNMNIGDVIYIDTPVEITKARIVGRISCPNCKAVYNEILNKPIHEGICDYCNTALVKRDDDNEATFAIRYQTYMRETQPLIEFFDKKGVLYKVDGTLSLEEIFNEIEKIINRGRI